MIEAITNEAMTRLCCEADCVTDNLRVAVNDLFITLDGIEHADEPPMYAVELYTMQNGNETYRVPHERVALDEPFKHILCGDEHEAMTVVSEIMAKRYILGIESFCEWLEQEYPLLSE